eukprot:403346016
MDYMTSQSFENTSQYQENSFEAKNQGFQKYTDIPTVADKNSFASIESFLKQDQHQQYHNHDNLQIQAVNESQDHLQLDFLLDQSDCYQNILLNNPDSVQYHIQQNQLDQPNPQYQNYLNVDSNQQNLTSNQQDDVFYTSRKHEESQMEDSQQSFDLNQQNQPFNFEHLNQLKIHHERIVQQQLLQQQTMDQDLQTPHQHLITFNQQQNQDSGFKDITKQRRKELDQEEKIRNTYTLPRQIQQPIDKTPFQNIQNLMRIQSSLAQTQNYEQFINLTQKQILPQFFSENKQIISQPSPQKSAKKNGCRKISNDENFLIPQTLQSQRSNQFYSTQKFAGFEKENTVDIQLALQITQDIVNINTPRMDVLSYRSNRGLKSTSRSHNKYNPVEEFRQNLAAKKIQRVYRTYLIWQKFLFMRISQQKQLSLPDNQVTEKSILQVSDPKSQNYEQLKNVQNESQRKAYYRQLNKQILDQTYELSPIGTRVYETISTVDKRIIKPSHKPKQRSIAIKPENQIDLKQYIQPRNKSPLNSFNQSRKSFQPQQNQQIQPWTSTQNYMSQAVMPRTNSRQSSKTQTLKKSLQTGYQSVIERQKNQSNLKQHSNASEVPKLDVAIAQNRALLEHQLTNPSIPVKKDNAEALLKTVAKTQDRLAIINKMAQSLKASPQHRRLRAQRGSYVPSQSINIANEMTQKNLNHSYLDTSLNNANLQSNQQDKQVRFTQESNYLTVQKSLSSFGNKANSSSHHRYNSTLNQPNKQFEQQNQNTQNLDESFQSTSVILNALTSNNLAHSKQSNQKYLTSQAQPRKSANLNSSIISKNLQQIMEEINKDTNVINVNGATENNHQAKLKLDQKFNKIMNEIRVQYNQATLKFK